MYRAIPMYRTLLIALFALGAVLAFPGSVWAEPEDPAAEEEVTDESFASGLVGTSYTGDLDLEGWTNYGGGLVAPPIYVNLYRREDGTSLVLTSKLSGSTYSVTDALIISKPWKGYVISIACTQGEDFTLRFIGDARGPAAKEWWSEVRRAWEIAVEQPPDPEAETEADAPTETGEAGDGAEAPPKIEPGKITKANTRGVKCTNPDW